MSELQDIQVKARNLPLVAASFVVFGLYWGSWVVAAADVERELGFSHGKLGLLLSISLAGAAFTNAVGGVLTERRGTAHVLAGALAVWGSLIFVATFVHGALLFGVLLVAIVTVGGLYDVVINVAATAALADRPGALVRFHAFFNGAAAAGAAITATLISKGFSWRGTWSIIGVLAWIVAALCVRATLPAGDAGERLPLTGAISLLRRERLVLIAVAFAAAAMVENGTELWGVVLLRTHLPRGLLVGGTSAVAGYLVAAAARVFIGPVAGRRSAAHGVVAGTLAAAAGIVALSLAREAWLAGAGLVLAAGGVSLCWPLLLAHASGGRARPGAIVGGVTAVGYLGFVVGPALVGLVADATGLRSAILILCAAALYVAVSVRVTARR